MERAFRREFIGFCAIEAVYFAIFANYSYQSVWLKEVGIGSSQIGLMVSIASIIGIAACLIWGSVSDKLGSSKKVFIAVVSITGVLYAFLPVLRNAGSNIVGILFVYIPLIYFFKQSGTSMMDSWIISATSNKGIPYGSMRKWGSVGYAVMSVIWGAVVGKYIGTEVVFFSMIPLVIIFNLICLRQRTEVSENSRFLREKAKDSSIETKGKAWKKLSENKAFIVYMIYAFGLNVYIGVSIVFMPFILEAAGCKSEQIGIVTGFRAVIEFGGMYIGTKIARKLPLRYIMIIPGILFALEHLLYHAAGNLRNMMSIMILSGAAGGLSRCKALCRR